MTTTAEIKVPVRLKLEIDDRTRAALVALGWTPPPAESAETCRCGQPLEAGHCEHCHDDPPTGHRCPRCGIAKIVAGEAL